MLCELRIENFAIIDRLELSFKAGLITFTGETGAGKSIIIDAVETLLGGRAETTMIRSGASRALIEATFRIPQQLQEMIHSILIREDLFDDPEYFTISREIRSEGRSIARLNGRSVNLNLLKEIGELILDLHGQSEHLSLLRVREHLNLLDRFADTADLLSDYKDVYQKLGAVRKELQQLKLSESEAARRLDLLEYQINEITSARLNLEEEDLLRAERTRLANAEALTLLTQQAIFLLDEDSPDSPSVLDLLGQLSDLLQDLERNDPSKTGFVEIIHNSFEILSDLARELRSYQDEIEFNPARLSQVEERLNLIHNLKRKYGKTIPEILEFAERARRERETLTHAEERIEILTDEENKLLAEVGKRGIALSACRHQAARELESLVEQELNDLNMTGAAFKVKIQQIPDDRGAPIEGDLKVKFDATGLDKVEFLIAPNPGEGLKPLVKIASGGENSRLMLALKNVLARADHIPTLIFDEIDQGIGGRVGTIVGQKLWQLARHHQVLCVTHLPQLAAFGDQHFQVQKILQDGRTITRVADLSGEERLTELAHMLGEKSPGTLLSARDMLQTADALRQN